MNGIVNHPTDAENEQLALLTEETGEAQQIIGKIGRHGLDSRHPNGGPPNAQLLETEIGHVLAAIDILVAAGTLNKDRILEARMLKLGGVQRWLHCESNIRAAADLHSKSFVPPPIERI